MSEELSGSEAIYGFVAWLTCRKEKTVMGASEDCSPVVELIGEFCKENKLTDPRDGWQDNLVHPSSE